jgi:hypothetical protein
MKTIADFKRAMRVGTVVTVTDHKHPALNGERTIVKAQSQRLCLTLPADHPRAGDVTESWFDIPKRADFTFDGDSVRIADLMTITVKS